MIDPLAMPIGADQQVVNTIFETDARGSGTSSA